MTDFLYWEDPYLKTFQAKIVAIHENKIVLDKTAFYPQGGNQLSDKGFIEKGDKPFKIEFVSKEEDNIYHQISSDNIDELEVGDVITGHIDWEYRYGIMRAHSSQHLLSAIIKNRFDIDTAHANILFEEVMLQIANEITDAQLKEALHDLNEMCSVKNHIFETHIISKSQLAEYSERLRGKTPDDELIRLVEVKNNDLICCGGTHVKNSTEIGAIFLYEFKKGTDIKYVVGTKAIKLISQLNVDVLSYSNLLRIQIADLFSHLKKQHEKNEVLEQNYIKFAEMLLQQIAHHPHFLIKNTKVSILELDLDYKFLQKHFKEFPEEYVLIITKKGNKIIIISNSREIKANEVMDYLLKHYGGKGGGSPYSAQGTLERTPADILSEIKALFS